MYSHLCENVPNFSFHPPHTLEGLLRSIIEAALIGLLVTGRAVPRGEYGFCMHTQLTRHWVGEYAKDREEHYVVTKFANWLYALFYGSY